MCGGTQSDFPVIRSYSVTFGILPYLTESPEWANLFIIFNLVCFDLHLETIHLKFHFMNIYSRIMFYREDCFNWQSFIRVKSEQGWANIGKTWREFSILLGAEKLRVSFLY